MSAFDRAEARILIALFIAHHGERREILTWEDLEARYHTDVSKMHFEAIVDELSQRGVVKVFRDKDGSGVLLLDHGIRYAHDKILAFLDANTFDVNWKTERITTDAESDIGIPCADGWMLLHVDKDEPKPKPNPDEEAVTHSVPHAISAGRDVIMNVGSHGANAQGSAEHGPRSESGWVKSQTVFAVISVLVGLAAIIVTIRLAGH